MIASIAAGGPEEWVEIASTLEDSGVAAVELNLSCPHFEGGGLELGQDLLLWLGLYPQSPQPLEYRL